MSARWLPAPPSGSLLDTPSAHRLLKSLKRTIDEREYFYQQPLETHPGPRVQIGGRPVLMLSSYDYLGLIGDPRIDAAAHEALRLFGTSSGGVRLLTGTTRLHLRLEADLAAFKRTESALVVGSGYAANLAAIAGLFGPRDAVLVDGSAHRSLIDACNLARARLRRFRHNQPAALEQVLRSTPAARRLVVVEGVYSMDGDICPLREIVAIARAHDAFVLVDESHSLGVLGPGGRGVDDHFGLNANEVDIWTGSLSKAVPATGGFVAGSRELILYLQHAAPPFVFSAALSPSSAAAAQVALAIIAAEPERRARVMTNASHLRSSLSSMGYQIGASATPIVPVIVGDEHCANRLSRLLFARDILATPIVAPAVPMGQARLRLCVSAAHEPSDIDEALDAFSSLRLDAPSRRGQELSYSSVVDPKL